MTLKSFIYIILPVVILVSCKEEKKATISFSVQSSGKTPINRSYNIDASKTKILFSNFKVIDVNGNEILLKDVFLYKSSNNQFSVDVPEGNYTAFKFSYGLDKVTNNSIPMSFPASNPLSVEEGLYWDMLKYRFSIVEATIDDSPAKNQIPDAPFSMHLGSDTLYTEITTTKIPYNGSKITVQLNMDKLFVLDTDPFLISNFSNHSEPSEIERAIAIKNSFIDGISIDLSVQD